MGGGLLAAYAAVRNAIDGGRRREYELSDAFRDAGLEQIMRVAGVIPVVAERVGNGIRNDGERGKVHHRIDVVFAQ